MGEFGERLRSARQARGLSISALAQATGVSARSIVYYEAGRIPTGDVLLRLADHLGTSMRYLLTGEDFEGTLPTLPPDEAALLAAYRRLSPDRRARAVGYLEGLAAPYGGAEAKDRGTGTFGR